jgi:hypothetical protein
LKVQYTSGQLELIFLVKELDFTARKLNVANLNS